MSTETHNNRVNNELTVTEKMLIAAVRAGDVSAVLRLFADGVDGEETFSPTGETLPDSRLSDAQIIHAHNQDTPDVADRLAAAIVGMLTRRLYLTNTILYGEGGSGMYYLMKDIGSTIRAELPHTDIMALKKLHEGFSE